jgi:hypothetical protein
MRRAVKHCHAIAHVFEGDTEFFLALREFSGEFAQCTEVGDAADRDNRLFGEGADEAYLLFGKRLDPMTAQPARRPPAIRMGHRSRRTKDRFPPTAALRAERKDLGTDQFAHPKAGGSRHRIKPKFRTRVYQSR